MQKSNQAKAKASVPKFFTMRIGVVFRSLIFTLAMVITHGHAMSVNEAAARGKLDEIKSAIKDGANLDAIDKSGFTPLEWCIIENRIEIAEALLDARANPNLSSADDYPLIIRAISDRRTVIVRLLVEAGAKLEARKYDGSTPLMEAVNTGNVDIVTFLLNAGADTKAKNKNGKTALGIARESENTEIIRLLEQAASR